jgi:SET family sugar efflux transporter-like MFS transporter
LVAILLFGLADSMVGPYLVLFGANQAHLSPFAIGVLVSAIAISGMAISTWLGGRYDRSPSRWPALLALIAPAAGYLLLTTTVSYAALLVIGVTLLGAQTAAFPQLFTLARSGAETSSSASAPVLRSAWSLAWAIGPLIGAVLLSAAGFTGLFLAAALTFTLVTVPLALLGRTPPAAPAPTEAADGPSRPTMLPVLSFTLFHTAMFAGGVVLPLYVTKALDRPDHDVGLLFSVCAFAEIPAALALLLLPARIAKARVILLGMALLAVYSVLIATTSSLPVLIGSQVARGVAIAVVGVLAITYFQDLLPEAAGRATTLYANTAAAGSLLSGILAGTAAQLLGYRWALVLCGALAVIAVVLLKLSPAGDGREPAGDGREPAGDGPEVTP